MDQGQNSIQMEDRDLRAGLREVCAMGMVASLTGALVTLPAVGYGRMVLFNDALLLVYVYR